MTLENLVSLILYAAFVIYTLFGVFGYILNRESRLNQIFLVLSLTFSIWAFTFAAMTSAPTWAEALLWRRCSVLGWGISFSAFLHFLVILTGSTWGLRARRPYLLLLLYLPSLVLVFFFGLYDPTASVQYVLVHTVAGWAVAASNNWLDCLFYSYYVLVSLASVFLLARWNLRTRDPGDKKKSGFLLTAFCLSFAAGTFTDIIGNHVLPYRLPALSPVTILILVLTLFYIIYKYNLLVPLAKKEEKLEGIILSSPLRKTLFKGIGIFLIAGGTANYLLWLWYPANRIMGLMLSFCLIMACAVIVITPYVTDKPQKQESVLALILAFMLPLIMLTYLDEYFSTIIWPVPLFFIMVTVIFSHEDLFFWMAFLSMLTGVVYWIELPDYYVEIAPLSYLLRLQFYGVAIFLTGLIRHLYKSRLDNNKKQKDFQDLIAAITTDFVKMTADDFDDNVRNLLSRSGDFFNADYAYLGTFSEDRLSIDIIHDWQKDSPQAQTAAEAPVNATISALPWGTRKLLNNELVIVSDLHKLPSEAKQELDMGKPRQTKSLIQIPIFNKDQQFQGLIGYEQITPRKQHPKTWEELNDAQFRMISNILADALEKMNIEKEMNHLAYYDVLTGLPNRVLFKNRLEQAIALSKRTGKKLGVIFMDLDGFKEVNDTLGHDWGDHLLKQIADRLAGCIRKYDTVARFGGDEFLILVPQIETIHDLNRIADKIMKVFEAPVTVREQEFHITASGGIGVYPEDGETPGALIKHADLAMYVAKKNGKGQYVFCSAEMKNDIDERVTLTNHLHQARDRNELFLLYQPQVSNPSGTIIGYEALLRWQHPHYGVILPEVFIPLAEQAGLISSLGEWVLTTACAQNKAWQDKGYPPVPMGVNLSIEQFRNADLVKQVRDCLKKTGLKPDCLELEITESIAMEDSQAVNRCLNELKELGVRISIDDFGTEFSSLSRLKDLPIDRIKIDMQFIRGIGKNSKDEAIIAVMIHLARSLGLRIIAEGVETAEQIRFLKNQDCHEMQGYYYHQPRSPKSIESEIYMEDE